MNLNKYFYVAETIIVPQDTGKGVKRIIYKCHVSDLAANIQIVSKNTKGLKYGISFFDL